MVGCREKKRHKLEEKKKKRETNKKKILKLEELKEIVSLFFSCLIVENVS